MYLHSHERQYMWGGKAGCLICSGSNVRAWPVPLHHSTLPPQSPAVGRLRSGAPSYQCPVLVRGRPASAWLLQSTSVWTRRALFGVLSSLAQHFVFVAHPGHTFSLATVLSYILRCHAAFLPLASIAIMLPRSSTMQPCGRYPLCPSRPVAAVHARELGISNTQGSSSRMVLQPNGLVGAAALPPSTAWAGSIEPEQGGEWSAEQKPIYRLLPYSAGQVGAASNSIVFHHEIVRPWPPQTQ
jgi:hypothetical protein